MNTNNKKIQDEPEEDLNELKREETNQDTATTKEENHHQKLKIQGIGLVMGNDSEPNQMEYQETMVPTEETMVNSHQNISEVDIVNPEIKTEIVNKDEFVKQKEVPDCEENKNEVQNKPIEEDGMQDVEMVQEKQKTQVKREKK